MGKVVIVTGGSRGIGAATCRLAALRGYAVCVNYVRNREAAEVVVADCLRAGGQAIAVQADVAVEADVVRLFETTDRELGRLTDLVNNAGATAPMGFCMIPIHLPLKDNQVRPHEAVVGIETVARLNGLWFEEYASRLTAQDRT
jgi:NAD(P)-dependent dehydrogenase (short-subunit alcohol dehydrogenase family)